MKKTLMITFCAIVCICSLNASFGFKAYGSARALESEDVKGYSIRTIGGALLFGYTEKDSGLGFEGSLGVSTAAPQWRSSCCWWGTMETVYDYSIRAGLCWEHWFRDFGLHADVHASWDSVAFQRGTGQEWDRFSFHTLGIGCGIDVSFNLAPGSSSNTSICIGASRDWGLLTLTAARSRHDWHTSSAEVEKIDAGVRDWRISVGVLADM